MKKNLVIAVLLLWTTALFSQRFEEPQLTGEEFEHPKVKVGGDFALQYQILKHHADYPLIPLGTGFNLPTANMNLDAYLAKGIKLNLVTYLSSRHHNDTWVKGGYILFDKLPFINSPGIDRAMDYLTFKVGDMELNYGDEHFRRSDNGHVTDNPFVGNYIMDAFTTAPAFELMFRHPNGILAMAGVTSGILKQDLTTFNANDSVYTAYNTIDELAFYYKAGYDKQLNEDFRLRLTFSGYNNPKNHSGSLYNGDRTGSRYYLVMKLITDKASDVDITSGHTSGRFGPGSLAKTNAYMFNLFSTYKGFEFFGTFETMSGLTTSQKDTKFSQYAAEGLYRFGGKKQFYGGMRYDFVKDRENDMSVNRVQADAGWFMIPSILFKIEYVNQNYNDFAVYGNDAGFNGFMLEAAVSF